MNPLNTTTLANKQEAPAAAPAAPATPGAQAATPLPQARAKRKQRGFTMIELTAVILIGTLISIGASSVISSLLLESRIAPTARDISGAVLRIRTDAEGAGTATPYTTFGTAAFASKLINRVSSLTTAGAGGSATAQHKLGASNSQISCAPATIGTAGDSYACTLPTVNKTACPGLATSLSSVASTITINGTTVLAREAATPVNYNGSTAEIACTGGDTNTYVFTFR
jgi:type IV pilus assembly protein PilA